MKTDEKGTAALLRDDGKYAALRTRNIAICKVSVVTQPASRMYV